MKILLACDYPGNVRELENIIEHAFVLCPGGIIKTEHLPQKLRPSIENVEAISSLADLEKKYITTVLRKNNWNRLASAKALGIHKTTLFRKIKKLGIRIPR